MQYAGKRRLGDRAMYKNRCESVHISMNNNQSVLFCHHVNRNTAVTSECMLQMTDAFHYKIEMIYLIETPNNSA